VVPATGSIARRIMAGGKKNLKIFSEKQQKPKRDGDMAQVVEASKHKALK
jgi:hypothetical protein